MYRRTAMLAALLLAAAIDTACAATTVVCPPQWGPATVMVQQEPVPAPPGWTSPGKWSGGGRITQTLFAYQTSLPPTCDPSPGSAWRATATIGDSKGQITGQQFLCRNGADLNALIDPAVCTITCR